MNINKKYRILVLGIIMLGLGSTIATISLVYADNVGKENFVIHQHPIAPGETKEGSFTTSGDFDVNFFVNNFYGGKILEVEVTDELGNQVFFQTNIHEDIEEVMSELEDGKYFVSVKNLDTEYARADVIVRELDGIDRSGIFLSFSFVGIVALMVAFVGLILAIIGTMKFFRYRKQNENLANT